MLERTHAQNTQTLLSSRIPRDTEHDVCSACGAMR